MAIFIISRRPPERAWSYINHFTSDNAEVSAMSRREAAYEALRRRADRMAHSWRVAEPEAEFRVMDSGINNQRDKFDPEFDKVVEPEAPLPRAYDNILSAVDFARRVIAEAEHDLMRKLSRGECNDLLLDNTDWSRSEVVSVMDSIGRPVEVVS